MEIKKIPVYLFSYRKSYYWAHPFKFVKELWTGAKNLWHRARYGYAYVDAWNMNSAWCEMGANMLLHLSKYGSAYPGTGEFDTPEKWHDHLEEMAQRLRECAQIDTFENNEYWELYKSDFKNGEMELKWRQRQYELENTREQLIKETFEIFGKNFDMYWD